MNMFKTLLKSEKEHSERQPISKLEILGNKYICKILSLISNRECSAMELSNELNIPLATVYRKIKFLEENDMIEVSKTIINLSGNEEKYYRCLIDDITVNFHSGKISIDVKKFEPTKKIVRLWERVAKSGFSQNDKAIAD